MPPRSRPPVFRSRPNPAPIVNTGPLEAAYQQEQRAVQKNDSEAQYQDLIKQEAEQNARQAKALEQSQRQQVAAAKKAGVKTRVDETGTELIERHSDGKPVYAAGFQGGAKPVKRDDGTESTAFPYRDPRGTEHQIDAAGIRRKPAAGGGYEYEFEIGTEDGQKRKVRQLEESSNPLFKIDEKTGNRLVDTVDPITGSVTSKAIGIDPEAATKATIEKQKQAWETRKAELTFQEQTVRQQKSIDDLTLQPIKEKLTEAEKSLKDMMSKRRYEQRDGKLMAIEKIGEEDFPSEITDEAEKINATKWLESKSALDKRLADIKAEHDPLEAKVSAAELQSRKLALQATREAHAALVRERELIKQAEAGAPIWESDFQKRLENAQRDPRFTSAITEGQLADEANPLLDAPKFPELPATNRLMVDLLSNTPAAYKPGVPFRPEQPGEEPLIGLGSTYPLNQLLERMPTARTLPDGTKDVTEPAKAFGALDPTAYHVAVDQDGDGAPIVKTATGMTLARVAPDGRSLRLEPDALTTEDGRAMVFRADPTMAPVYAKGDAQPFTPQEKRDYFNAAISTATMGDEAAMSTVGADIPGIRQQFKNGRLSAQDANFLLKEVHGVEPKSMAAADASKELAAYVGGSQIESALWSGPNANPVTRREVVDRFMDNYALQAQSSLVYDGKRLEDLRSELRNQFAKPSNVLVRNAKGLASTLTGGLYDAPEASFLEDTPKMLAGSVVGLAGNVIAGVGEGLFHLATFGNFEATERAELFGEGSMEWFKNASGFARRLRSGPVFDSEVNAMKEWADSASPGDTPPANLAESMARTTFGLYHGLTADGQNAADANTSEDTFNPTKDPILSQRLNRYLNTRSPEDWQAFTDMLAYDGKSRTLADRVQKYITKPRAANAGEVAERAAKTGITLSPEKSSALLALAAKKPTTKAEYDATIKQAENITGLKGKDAELAMDLWAKEESVDPTSLEGYIRGGFQAPIQEIGTEAISWALGAGLGKVAAGGIKGAIKGTVAATRKASTAGYFASRAANLLDDFERMGMFKAKFGTPLTKGQRLSNAAVSLGKAATVQSVDEFAQEGLMAVGEPGSGLGTVVEAGAGGAAAGLLMVGGTTALALPSSFRADSRAAKAYELGKTAQIEKINAHLRSIPGSKPLTAEDYDAVLAVYGGTEAVQHATEVSAAKQELDAANAVLAEAMATPEGRAITQQANVKKRSQELKFRQAELDGKFGPRQDAQGNQRALTAEEQQIDTELAQLQTAATGPTPTRTDAIRDARRQVHEAKRKFYPVLSQIVKRETQAVNAVAELQQLPPEQRTLYTAVAKARLGQTEYTQAEADALNRLAGSQPTSGPPQPIRWAIAPNVAAVRDQGLPNIATTLPQNRLRIAQGSVPIIPDELLTEIATNAPILGEMLATSTVREAQAQQQIAAEQAVRQDNTAAVLQSVEAFKSANPGLAARIQPGTSAEGASGMAFDPSTGIISYDVERVVEDLDRLAQSGPLTPETRTARIETLLNEEVTHLADETAAANIFAELTGGLDPATTFAQALKADLVDQINAALGIDSPFTQEYAKFLADYAKNNPGFQKPTTVFGAWKEAYYARLASEFTPEQTAMIREAYGSTYDQLPSQYKVREGVRMLSQVSASKFGRITESLFRHVKALVDALKALLVNPPANIRRHLQQMDKFLAEVGIIKQKDGPAQPDLPNQVNPGNMATGAAETPKSSTQFTLTAEDAAPILAFGQSIPQDELSPEAMAENGTALEDEPHVTALYGLTDPNAEPVQQAIADHGPVTIKLGNLSVFENDKYDVLVIDIESDSLRSLNKKLSKLPNRNTFPDYKPHMTIAYLKKGEGAKYVGDSRFAGETITFETLTFSPPKDVRDTLGRPELPLQGPIGLPIQTNPAQPNPAPRTPSVPLEIRVNVGAKQWRTVTFQTDSDAKAFQLAQLIDKEAAASDVATAKQLNKQIDQIINEIRPDISTTNDQIKDKAVEYQAIVLEQAAKSKPAAITKPQRFEQFQSKAVSTRYTNDPIRNAYPEGIIDIIDELRETGFGSPGSNPVWNDYWAQHRAARQQLLSRPKRSKSLPQGQVTLADINALGIPKKVAAGEFDETDAASMLAWIHENVMGKPIHIGTEIDAWNLTESTAGEGTDLSATADLVAELRGQAGGETGNELFSQVWDAVIQRIKYAKGEVQTSETVMDRDERELVEREQRVAEVRDRFVSQLPTTAGPQDLTGAQLFEQVVDGQTVSLNGIDFIVSAMDPFDETLVLTSSATGPITVSAGMILPTPTIQEAAARPEAAAPTPRGPLNAKPSMARRFVPTTAESTEILAIDKLVEDGGKRDSAPPVKVDGMTAQQFYGDAKNEILDAVWNMYLTTYAAPGYEFETAAEMLAESANEVWEVVYQNGQPVAFVAFQPGPWGNYISKAGHDNSIGGKVSNIAYVRKLKQPGWFASISGEPERLAMRLAVNVIPAKEVPQILPDLEAAPDPENPLRYSIELPLLGTRIEGMFGLPWRKPLPSRLAAISQPSATSSATAPTQPSAESAATPSTPSASVTSPIEQPTPQITAPTTEQKQNRTTPPDSPTTATRDRPFQTPRANPGPTQKRAANSKPANIDLLANVKVETEDVQKMFTPEMVRQAINIAFGQLDQSVIIHQWQNQEKTAPPRDHLIRGRGLVGWINSTNTAPHIIMPHVALPIVPGQAKASPNFIGVMGDKSEWVNIINDRINELLPDLDDRTDIYIEPYGGALTYLQNIDVLMRTDKPVLIASAQAFEPDRNMVYNAIKEGTPKVMEDMQTVLRSVNYSPSTDPGRAIKRLLENNRSDKAGKDPALSLKSFRKLAELLRRDNVEILPDSDVTVMQMAVNLANEGNRITFIDDSNYVNLPWENTPTVYAWEEIGKNPYYQHLRKQATWAPILAANGTVIATNHMDFVMLPRLMAEFGADGVWHSFPHQGAMANDYGMRHKTGGFGRIVPTERAEFFAILNRDLVVAPAVAPKYGRINDGQRSYAPRAQSPSLEEMMDLVVTNPPWQQVTGLVGATHEALAIEEVSQSKPTQAEMKLGAAPATHTFPDGYTLTEQGNQTLPAAPVAYHGTPYQVDQFRTDRIGTGEGAQAYGWGLYFAENRDIASSYRKKLSAKYTPIDGSIEAGEAAMLLGYHGTKNAVFNQLKSDVQDGYMSQDKAAKIRQIIDQMNSNEGGNLYTVQLLPDESEFLNWDKSLTEQSPAFKDAFLKIFQSIDWSADAGIKVRQLQQGQVWFSGKTIYNALQSIIGGQNASNKLLALGIPGIVYKDANSRSFTGFSVEPNPDEFGRWWITNGRERMFTDSQQSAQEIAAERNAKNPGTRNFVIFDQNLVKILAKNGDPVEQQNTPSASLKLYAAAATRAINTSSTESVREHLKNHRLVTDTDVLATLGDYPGYLDSVSEFILAQRQKLIDGKFTARDVAKAYAITVASQGADATSLSTIQAVFPKFKPGPEFTNTGAKGQLTIRPEEAAAYWFFTPTGQRALNSIEKGKLDTKAWNELAAIRKIYGDDRLGNTGLLVDPEGVEVPVYERNADKSTVRDADGNPVPKLDEQGNPIMRKIALNPDTQANLTNIQKVVDAVNAAKDDSAALMKALVQLRGIGDAKKAFIGHLLGFGGDITTDAVEINYWITGRGDTGQLGRGNDKSKVQKSKENYLRDLAKAVTKDKASVEALSERIKKSFRRLRSKNPDIAAIPEEIFNHIMHHWLWDRAKGIETTHTGMMRAQALAAAPVTYVEPGFYSALNEAIKNKMPARANAATVTGIVRNSGLKAEEIKWSGIVPWLESQPKEQPITKQQVLDYLATQGRMRFQVTQLGKVKPQQDTKGWSIREIGPERFALINPQGEHVDDAFTREEAESAIADFAAGQDTASGIRPTRNTQWTLPGGTNQREVIVSLGSYSQRFKTWAENRGIDNIPEAEDAVFAEYGRSPIEVFGSPNNPNDKTHYGDLDALAWFRANDRDGGQGLLIDELQSKWHQLGRDQGYQSDLPEGWAIIEIKDGPKRYGNSNYLKLTDPQGNEAGISPQGDRQRLVQQANRRQRPSAVADAPYRKDWYLMLFKRALADAVAEDKQWIGWTVGETQADRYDLSKRLNRVTATALPNGKFNITAFDPRDNVAHDGDHFPSELQDVLGKELASQIIADLTPTSTPIADIDKRLNEIGGADGSAPGTEQFRNNIAASQEGQGLLNQLEATNGKTDYSSKTYSGLDLKVGGEGMKAFYDSILPKEIGKYVKQWGAKVEKGDVTTDGYANPPTWETFTENDWDTFSGAEEFRNGDQPIIGTTEMKVGAGKEKFVVIIDPNGVEFVNEELEVYSVPKQSFPGSQNQSPWQSVSTAKRVVSEAWVNPNHPMWTALQEDNNAEAEITPVSGTTPIWKIDITDDMRKGVSAGQALFAAPIATPDRVSYASGVNKATDAMGAIQANVPFGTTAPLINTNKPLANLIKNALKAGTPIFVDSGAFSETDTKPVDFAKVFRAYNELAKERGPLSVVAPDKVRFQKESLERILKHKDDIEQLLDQGVRVIVPVQRGEMDIAQYIKATGLDPARIAIGIPSNKGAYPRELLTEHIRASGVKDIHYLGMSASNANAQMMVNAAERAGATRVTLDANRIRSGAGDAIKQPDAGSPERMDLRADIEMEWVSDLSPEERVQVAKDSGFFTDDQLNDINPSEALVMVDAMNPGFINKWLKDNKNTERDELDVVRIRQVSDFLASDRLASDLPDANQGSLFAAPVSQRIAARQTASKIKTAFDTVFPHVDLKDRGDQISVLAGDTRWDKYGNNIKTIPGGDNYTGIAIRVYADDTPFVRIDEMNVASDKRGKGLGIKMLEAIQKGGVPVYHSMDMSGGFWEHVKATRPELFNRSMPAAPARAYESMTFDPPFKTSFGDIISYHWMSRPDGQFEVSDWSQAKTNPMTGRKIVHHFKVQKEDETSTVSLETAMGRLSDTDRTRLSRQIKTEQQRREDEQNGQGMLFAAAATVGADPADHVEAKAEWNDLGIKSAFFKSWTKGTQMIPLGAKHDYKTGQPVTIESIHGTFEQFDDFDPSKFGITDDLDDDMLGRGVYSTQSTGQKYGNGTAARLFVRLKNPIVVTGPDELFDEMAKAPRLPKGEFYDGIAGVMQALGYDGAIAKVGGQASEIVAFDPANAAIAEWGTFEGMIRNSMLQAPPPQVAPAMEQMMLFAAPAVITPDAATIKKLDNEPTVTRYRAMAMIDGKLYPPMSTSIGRDRRPAEPIGKWMQAEERPDLVPTTGPNAGKFRLKGPTGKDVWALYAPYFHSSQNPLNDQFSAAYSKPLVTVEIEIPAKDDYQAPGSKRAAGDHRWAGGRIVSLSRYAKIKRVVPDSEVAKLIRDSLPTGTTIPDNVVTPSLRKELEKIGVGIQATGIVPTLPAAPAARTSAADIDFVGIQPALLIKNKPYLGVKGMWHGDLLGHWVQREVYTPQQRRDDPTGSEAVVKGYELIDDTKYEFGDFGFYDHASGEFLDRTQAADAVKAKGLRIPSDSWAGRYNEMDSSDIELIARLNRSQLPAAPAAPNERALTPMEVDLLDPGIRATRQQHLDYMANQSDEEVLNALEGIAAVAKLTGGFHIYSRVRAGTYYLEAKRRGLKVPEMAILEQYTTVPADAPQLTDSADKLLTGAPASPPESTEAFERALKEMPPMWASVLQQSMRGESIPSMARRMDLSEVAVSNILRNAQGRLSALMKASEGNLKARMRLDTDGVMKYTGGRPDLAFGANPNYNAIDRERATPLLVTRAEMNEAAHRLFEANPEQAERLVTHYLDTQNINDIGMDDAVQKIVADATGRDAKLMLMDAAAQLLITRKSFQGGDPVQVARLVHLIDSRRATRTDLARALGMGVDPHMTPAERHAMVISSALHSPPQSIQLDIEKNPANRENLLARWAAKSQKIKQALVARGIDIDATFAHYNAEWQAARDTLPEAIREPLAREERADQVLVRSIMEGETPTEAAARAGLTLNDAQARYRGLWTRIATSLKAIKNQMLPAAPATDPTNPLPSPDLFDTPDQPAVDNAKTQKLKRLRARPRPGNVINLEDEVDTAAKLQIIGTEKSSLLDAIIEYRRASILTGPQTQVVNTVSAITYGAYEATLKKLGTAALADFARLFGMKPDAASLADLPAMTSALVPSVRAAYADAVRAWKANTRVFEAHAKAESLTDKRDRRDIDITPAMRGVVGKVMNFFSFRAMLLADQFMVSLFSRLEVAAQARQIARNEGLSGQKMANRISELLVPGSEAWQRGLEQGQKITFQTPMQSGKRAIDSIDGIAKMITSANNGEYGKTIKVLTSIVFPFVSTPTNIFKQGMTIAPTGLFLGLIDAARALDQKRQGNTQAAKELYGAARALDDAINQTVAWGTMLALYGLIAPDEDDPTALPYVTGTLPWRATSKGERDIAYRTAPPQSIRIGGQWYSYRRLDPFATALAFVVDSLTELRRTGSVGLALPKVGVNILNNMQDKTFMTGISDIMNAIQNPDRYGQKWATNVVTGFVPNLIRQPLRNIDDVLRDTDLPNDMGFSEVLANRIGASIYAPAFLPPKVDLWGRPLKKHTGTGAPETDALYRILTPVDTQDSEAPDPLDVALQRWNMMNPDEAFSAVPPAREVKRTVNGEQRVVSLSDVAYNKMLTTAGQKSRAAIGNRYNGRDLTIEDVETIRKVVQQYQSQAREQAFRDNYKPGSPASTQ